MATTKTRREAWLATLANVISDAPALACEPCPNCGHRSLQLQYVADVPTTVGFLCFWCGHCLMGIDLSRVMVPPGIDFLPLTARPEEVAERIPPFTRVEK
ncbi:MAG: hypothetical protein ACR2PL_00155 [Dehalococcoidia bacterium]